MNCESEKILFGGPLIDNIKLNEKSFGQVIISKLRALGDHFVLINGLNGVKLTAFDLLEKSIHVAWSLCKSGVTNNDIISIFTENSFDFFAIWFGTAICGATFAPFNVIYSQGELQHIIGLIRPKIIFTSQKYKQILSKAISNFSFIENVVIIDQQNNVENGFTSFTEFLRKSTASEKFDFPTDHIDIDKTRLFIVTSSGTTGLPKGVQHPHLTMFKYYKRFAAEYIENQKNGYSCTRLMPMPFSHAYGLFNTSGQILNNFTVIFLPRYNPLAYLKAIETYKVNYMNSATPILVFLSKDPLVENYDLSSIKCIYAGSSPLSKELIFAVQKRLGSVKIRNNYGLSEMMNILGQTEKYCTPGSSGHLKPGVYGKIIDTDTGTLLGPCQYGEMLFKNGATMTGYLNNLNATREMFDEDGWCHTGDIGYYDENEEWFCVDRIKELIKYKGNQVPPAELEALILEHPAVNDVGVIGIPDDEAGELPLAFVVVKENRSISEKEICDFVAERISSVKHLHGGVRFINEIPKNNTGKILRRKLREMATCVKSKL